jgi:hypothetical protein
MQQDRSSQLGFLIAGKPQLDVACSIVYDQYSGGSCCVVTAMTMPVHGAALSDAFQE